MKRQLILFSFIFILAFPVLSDDTVNNRDEERISKAIELIKKEYDESNKRADQYRSLTITSIVAIGSALIGAFIPSLFNYLGKRRDLINEHNKKIYEEKLAVYKDFLQLIGDISVGVFNIPQNLEMFRRKSNLCLVYANNKLANEITEYYYFIMNEYKDYNEQNKDSDIEKKNRVHQTKFLNLMREELGIEQEKLKTGLVPTVKFYLDSLSPTLSFDVKYVSDDQSNSNDITYLS